MTNRITANGYTVRTRPSFKRGMNTQEKKSKSAGGQTSGETAWESTQHRGIPATLIVSQQRETVELEIHPQQIL